MATQQLTKGHLASFCVTALAIQGLATLLIVFLPEFYANAMGLPVGAVGVAFMTIRVVDLVVDLVMGGMMDATRTRWGRYRPWLVASAPILMISILMLFEAERGVTIGHLWGWLAVCFIGFSMIVLSHLAWAATLSRVPAERTRIFAWWQIFATAGQFAVLVIMPLAARARPEDEAFGIHVAGWVMAVLIPFAILLAVKFTPYNERPQQSEKTARFSDYIDVFKQKTVIRLVFSDLTITLSTGIANSVVLFYYMGQLGFDRATASTLVLIAYVGAFAGTPLFTKIAGRVGKAKALQIGALLQAAMQIGVAIQPANNFLLTAATVLTLGLCIPIAWFLPRAMMADVADASRALTGADRTGLLYASLNASMKIALGLAVGFSFLVLDWLNFDATTASDPANELPLRILVGAVPAALSLCVALIMQGYPEKETEAAALRQRNSQDGEGDQVVS